MHMGNEKTLAVVLPSCIGIVAGPCIVRILMYGPVWWKVIGCRLQCSPEYKQSFLLETDQRLCEMKLCSYHQWWQVACILQELFQAVTAQ